ALEGVRSHSPAEEADDDQREQETERGCGLDPRSVVAALAVGSVLRHVCRRAAILSAESEALEEAQEHEQNRGRKSDRRVGGQQADRRRRRPHHDDRDQERVFASDQIADTPENQSSEGADQEPRSVGHEGGQKSGRRITWWEEERREKRSESGVEVEV